MATLWTGRQYTITPAAGFDQMDTSCQCHYKNKDVETWSTLNVDLVCSGKCLLSIYLILVVFG